ncbi:hypothetical protein H4219_003213 [Mycoemilia scoparia]|uniref:Uncharacterized protein n=1 Tax=Mycoemilia scoparia TaxID=417184 RepID=A0A9W8A159_9FUNG|nr:hypothetical protein H4219_003213 [Mycoemilia scoparia]
MDQPTTKSHYTTNPSYLVNDTLNWIKQIKEKAKFDDSHNLTCDFVAIKHFLVIYLISWYFDISDAYEHFTDNTITVDDYKKLFQSFNSFEVMHFIGLFSHDDGYFIKVCGTEPLTPQEFFHQRAEKINKMLAGQGNLDAQAKGELNALIAGYLYVLNQCIEFILDVRFGHNGNTSLTEKDIMKDILGFITSNVSMKILHLKSYYDNLFEDERRLLRGEFNGYFEKVFKACYGGGEKTLYEDIQTFNPESITNTNFGVGSVDLLLVHLASCLEVGHSARVIGSSF